jgi:hypothetical protein
MWGFSSVLFIFASDKQIFFFLKLLFLKIHNVFSFVAFAHAAAQFQFSGSTSWIIKKKFFSKSNGEQT